MWTHLHEEGLVEHKYLRAPLVPFLGVLNHYLLFYYLPFLNNRRRKMREGGEKEKEKEKEKRRRKEKNASTLLFFLPFLILIPLHSHPCTHACSLSYFCHLHPFI
jgi:hypothetical protein